MSIDNFFTARSVQANVPGGPQVKGAKAVANGFGGLNFVDLILARIQESLAEAKTGENGEAPVLPDTNANALSSENTELNLAKILAANPEIKQEIEDFAAATGLGPDAALIQTLTLNQQAFDDALKPLSDGIITSAEIAKGSPRLFQALLIEDETHDDLFVNNIDGLKANLEKLLNEDPAALSALNLSPQDLSVLNNITGAEDINGLALQNPALGDALENIIRLVESHDAHGAIDNGTAQIADDPVLQNALALLLAPLKQAVGVKSGEAVPVAPLKTNLTPMSGDALAGIPEYEGNLQADLQGQMKKGQGGGDAMLQAAKIAAGAKDVPVSPLAPLPALNGMASDPALSFSQSMLEAYGLNANATTAMHAAVNVSAQASHASAPHPATQMIAVNMQKLSNGGDGNKTIALQLDPPELGRVEVRMEFGKDKTIKAVLMAEKPETFLMLQRDSQSLERALQEMGLDTDGGLSFELAEQGFEFDQNNQRGGGHEQGGTGSGEDSESEEIIESTMMWQVDANSGHTYYDILA